MPPNEDRPRKVDRDAEVSAVTLYAAGLSIRRVADQLGTSRSRVRQALRAAGVVAAPRGAGRPRPTRRIPVPEGVAEQLPILYLERRLTRRELADYFGVPEARIRAWMARLGVPTRTRGRANREDRQRLDASVLENLYVKRGHTADEAAVATGTSRREVFDSLREAGLPIRVPFSAAGEEHVVLEELYADELVAEVLERYNVPVTPNSGPLEVRFPDPEPVSAEL